MSCRSTYILSALFTCSAALAADAWAPNLTTEATWHSNATLADSSPDQFDSLQLKADLLASQRYPFGRDDALHLSGHLAGDWWPRYDALLRGAAGGRAEWRHQFGPNPRALIVAVEGAADAVEAKERGRRGVFTGVTASVRKRLDDLTRAMISHEVSWYDARLGTYDYGVSETSVELDRDLSSVMRVTFTARFREGDIVSYASGDRPDLLDRATSRLETNTFGRSMTAYRIDAHGWSAGASLVRAMDDSSALRIAYEYRATKRGPLSLPDHLLSVAIIHQF